MVIQVHIYLYTTKSVLDASWKLYNLFYDLCRNNEIYMLGDVSKWIPASSTRIRSIVYQEADLLINLWGGANEEITIHYVLNGKLKSSTCPIKTTGWNCISMLTGKCVYWSLLLKKRYIFRIYMYNILYWYERSAICEISVQLSWYKNILIYHL